MTKADLFSMIKEHPKESVVSRQWSVVRNQARVATSQMGLGFGHWSFIGTWSLLIGHCFLCGCAPSDESKFSSKLFSEVQIIGTRGTAPGQFNKPRSVAVDKD